MIADRDIAHAGANPVDDARRFVSRQHRQRRAEMSFDRLEIGVAKACRHDANDDIGFGQVADAQRLDGECSTRGAEHRPLAIHESSRTCGMARGSL